MIADEEAGLLEGAIRCSGWNNYDDPSSMAYMYYNAIADEYGFDIGTPYKDIPEDAKQVILYGTGEKKLKLKYSRSYGSGSYEMPFEGIITNLQRRYDKPTSEYARSDVGRYINNIKCPKCRGARLNDEVLAVTVGGMNIYEFTKLPIREEMEFINGLELTEREMVIADQVLREIKSRLKFLLDVGLEYLTLSRSSGTLSGGEAQRIRLATQIGSGLTGVLYILDEPSIGLHQRDNDRLIGTLKHLRDLGNTVIVVEHDDRHDVRGGSYSGYRPGSRRERRRSCRRRHGGGAYEVSAVGNGQISQRRAGDRGPRDTQKTYRMAHCEGR